MTAGGNSFRNATAHKVNSYYTLAVSYCTFCVGKHTILGPAILTLNMFTRYSFYKQFNKYLHMTARLYILFAFCFLYNGAESIEKFTTICEHKATTSRIGCADCYHN